MKTKLTTVYSIFIFLAILVFTGAFFEQFVFGPKFNRVMSNRDRFINSSLYLPLYGIFFLAIFRRPTIVRRCLGSMPTMGLLVLLSYISVGWSLTQSRSLLEATALTLTMVTAVGIASAVPFDVFLRATSKALLLITLASVVYIFVIPSWGRMEGIDLEELTNLGGLPQGVFKHKSRLAEVMSLTVLMGLTTGRFVPLWQRIPMVLIGGGLLYMTHSSIKVASCFIAATTWMLWVGSHHLKLKRTHRTIFLWTGVLYGVVGFIFGYRRLLVLFGEERSLQGRFEIWTHAYRYAEDRLIQGYGPASIWKTDLGFIPALPNFNVPHAHNTYIEVLLMFGLVGVFLVLAFLAKFMFDLFRAFSHNEAVYSVMVAICVSILLRSAFEFVLYQGNSGSFLIFMVFACYFYGRRGLDHEEVLT